MENRDRVVLGSKLGFRNNRSVLPAFQVAIQVQTLNRLHLDRFVGYK
jgi:hypothetical protein